MNFPIWLYLPTSVANPAHGLAEDFSGVIQAAGVHSGFRAGDAVFGMVPILSTGVLQSTIITDTRTTPLILKPDSWTHGQAAALLLVYLTARTVIASLESHLYSLTAPTIVVLGGSSSTGQWTVYLAASRGWTVHATCSAGNASLVRSMGAAHVIDYEAVSVPEAVRAAGPSAIMDCVGGTACIGLADRYVTIVGDKTSRLSMGGANTYLWNPQMVLRSWLGRLGLCRGYECVNLEMRRDYLLETLGLPPDKIAVDSTWAFVDVPAAYERMNTGRAKGKVVVTVDEDDAHDR